jgi:S1-C subfamily serine protease
MAGKGLLPGQSGTIKMKDGRVVVVKFVEYDSQTHLAKVNAVLQ